MSRPLSAAGSRTNNIVRIAIDAVAVPVLLPGLSGTASAAEPGPVVERLDEPCRSSPTCQQGVSEGVASFALRDCGEGER